MSLVTISKKGSIRLPAELRRKYCWKPGNSIRFVDYGGMITLTQVEELEEARTVKQQPQKKQKRRNRT